MDEVGDAFREPAGHVLGKAAGSDHDEQALSLEIDAEPLDELVVHGVAADVEPLLERPQLLADAAVDLGVVRLRRLVRNVDLFVDDDNVVRELRQLPGDGAPGDARPDYDYPGPGRETLLALLHARP